MKLLLMSNSTNHGSTPLAHVREEIARVLDGRAVTFVPYALADHDAYTEVVTSALSGLAAVRGIHRDRDPIHAVEQAEALYVGGGNTFRLLKTLQENGLLAAIQTRVASGMPYLGASAGTNIACPTIRTTNDMPIVWPETSTALGFLPFQINAHYLDPEPGSTHMGETRETRIREFHEENDTVVVGLREGGWLAREGDRLTVAGAGAKVFRRAESPEEVQPGADLSSLLRSGQDAN